MTIKRRDFLRMGSFITVSAATLGVTGCSLTDDDDDSPSSAPLPAEASGDNYWFPQGIVSADPKPDSIILWTRVAQGAKPVSPSLADVTALATADVSIRLQVSASANTVGSNAALSDAAIANVLVPARAQFDGTVRHKLTGLEAGKTYYYQFVAGNARSNIGQFKTAPAANSVDTVKFAFMSCQDWNSNHWAAYTDLASNSADLDFMVHLGDYIYETAKFSPSTAESRHGELTLPTGQVIAGDTVAAFPEDYRYLYKAYRSDPRIQAVHERLAMVAVWDDHEFSDDCWQNAETYTNLNQQQTARRRAANQSWYEFMPADISFSGNDPSFQNIKIYRDLKFGQTVHLVMTDERLYKSDHLIPESTVNPGTGNQLGRINSRYLAPEASLKSAEQTKMALGTSMSGGDPLRLISMLGREQREWWKSTMQSSAAAWKIWGNEVSLMRMGLNGQHAVQLLIGLGIQQAAAALPNPLTGNIGAGAATTAGTLFGITDKVDAATGAGAIAQVIGADVTNATKIATAKATAAGAYGVNGNVYPAETAALAAEVSVNAYIASVGAALAGASTQLQVGAAVQTIITAIANPANKNPLRAFLQKFLINADQWDGYSAERKQLMGFLRDGGIKNVVAITGDIHAFFAGQVYDDYAGEVKSINSSSVETEAYTAGTPVMVDLVTAGVSSSSWFTYLSEAAAQLSALLVTLVSFTLTKEQISAAASAATGTTVTFPVNVVLPVLDFTMGKPFSLPALQLMAKDALKKALAGAGIPEPAFTAQSGFSIDQVAGLLAGNTSLQGLCSALAALNGNPWLKHIDTDAQGYAVVTATSSNLQCTFKRVNELFVINGAGMAPGVFPGISGVLPSDSRPLVAREVTVTVAENSTDLTIA